MDRSEFKIIVCGGGLAGLLTITALSDGLRMPYKLIWIDDRSGAAQDAFYGGVTAPTAYDFLRGLGLDEPALFTRTNTSFSFGSHYLSWPGTTQDWVQAHHQPFPLIAGLPLQHHLTRSEQALQPLLISAQAARQGRFAHPPEDAANPLSRAEYGYQFEAQAWAALLRQNLNNTKIERIVGALENVRTENGLITALTLDNGTNITGDLFIDGTGCARRLVESLGGSFAAERTVAVRHTSQSVPQLGPPCRRIEASTSGWTAQTFLQDSIQTLSMSSATDTSEATHYAMGQVDAAWIGNCVAVGQSASAHDPLTPAPMAMLQRDIERLLSLIPVGDDYSMEAREFNRRFRDDFAHANMFSAAFYNRAANLEHPFWANAKAAMESPELTRKLSQFESRGMLVKYDLEPFNDEDWTILHLGLGRQPKRYDLQADAVPKAEAEQHLEAMRRAVANVVPRMPPHHVYVANMKRYFEKQNYA